MLKYERAWQRLMDWVPPWKRIRQMQEVIAMMEEDYDAQLLEMESRIEKLECAVKELKRKQGP